MLILRPITILWLLSTEDPPRGADACGRKPKSLLTKMYAIVDIAGSQIKVEAGMQVFVNRLAAKNGEELVFDKVLLVDDEGSVKVGSPYLEGVTVKATVVADDVKADKVLVFKKIRRKGFQKLNGHRQKKTKIQIDAIA